MLQLGKKDNTNPLELKISYCSFDLQIVVVHSFHSFGFQLETIS